MRPGSVSGIGRGVCVVDLGDRNLSTTQYPPVNRPVVYMTDGGRGTEDIDRYWDVGLGDTVRGVVRVGAYTCSPSLRMQMASR